MKLFLLTLLLLSLVVISGCCNSITNKKCENAAEDKLNYEKAQCYDMSGTCKCYDYTCHDGICRLNGKTDYFVIDKGDSD